MVLDCAKKFVSGGDGTKFDVLVIISPAMIKLEKADIIKELDEAFRKILNV